MSEVIGGLSGTLVARLIAPAKRLPAGAIIVLVAGALFVLSMLLGRRRGVLIQLWRQRRLVARVRQQHVLRALYELTEGEAGEGRAVAWERLSARRTWSARQLRRALHAAQAAGLVRPVDGVSFALTKSGWNAARQVVRNHRLWELYLLTHADVASGNVDRDADRIEHVLGPELVQELEELLARETPSTLPASPHALHGPAAQPGAAG